MVWYKARKKTYTITVLPKVEPTGIGIDGSDTVTQFKTMQLTAKLTPADASGTVTWSSDNEEILTVNEDGLVTGKRQGSATVTASVQGTAKKTLTATKTIKVVLAKMQHLMPQMHGDQVTLEQLKLI